MKTSERNFINSIYRFALKNLRLHFLGAVSRFIIALLVLWLSLALADQVFHFSQLTRWGLLFLNLVILLYVIFTIVIQPFLNWFRFNKNSNLSSSCTLLSGHYPDAKDGFLITYQLIRERSHAANGSPELRQAAIDLFLGKFARIEFKKQLRWVNYFPARKLFIPSLLVVLFLGSIQPQALLNSTLRLINPSRQYIQVPPFTFEILPGDVQLIKGASLQIKVLYHGPELAACTFTQNFSESLQQQKITGVDSSFSLDLKDVHLDFTYWINAVPKANPNLAEFMRSPVFKVRVITPPGVEQLDLVIESPTYTKRKPFTQERNLGDILAYPGSIVQLQALTNKMVKSASLLFDSGNREKLHIIGNRVSGTFKILRGDHYRFMLKDSTGLENQNPIRYEISLLQDSAPFVTITDPGQDTQSPVDGTLPMKIQAEDDFAVSGLALKYQINNAAGKTAEKWKNVELAITPGNIVDKETTLDFNQLPLAFGDTLEYFAKARDNNLFSGPSYGESKHYLVLFPSLDDLFSELDQQQDENIDILQDTREESKKMQQQLEEIQREMNRQPKLDWEKKQTLEKIVQHQNELQKKVDDLRKELDEAVNKLEQNKLISPQLIEKYNQLQKMFQEVLSPEMLKSLQDMQKALEQNNNQNLKQALQKFKLNQQAFEKNIERTMELLKRVQFEQKMDRLVKKAEQLAEQQQKISEQLEASQEQSIEPQTQKMQEQQKQQLSNLSEDTKQFLQEELLQQFPKTREQVDSVNAALQDSAMQKMLSDLEDEMAAQQQPLAQQNSAMIQQNFERLQKQLQKAQQGMQQQSKNQIAQKMKRIRQNLLQLSIQQEKIQNETRRTSPLGNNFNSNLKKQGQTLNNFNTVLQQLADLSKETFFLPPQMSSSLQKASAKMQQSLAQLSEREKGNALRSQSESMQALNQSVLQLSQGLSQMMNSNSGTGFDEFMKKMQQMAGQQGQLNQQSLELMQGQGNPGILSQQGQARARRLGHGQSALRKALQEMAQEMGQRDDMLGDLNQIAREMEQVEQDLLRAQPDRQTIQRQQRILSRMLDSQHSLEKREFSKKRQSEQGKNYVLRDPGDQGTGLVENKKAVEEALRNARKQGFSPDYQKLIELYFEKLLRSEQSIQQ